VNQRLLGPLFAVFVLSSTGCGQSTPAAVKLPAKDPGRYVERMTVGGFDRSYILRVPRAYDGTKPLPLVIVLHGWTASARIAEQATHMGEESDKEGFVMVAPDGVGSPQGWNAGFINLSGKQVDDVKFIDALLDKVESEVGIDTDRVFVAGHSNGAFLANLLAARLSTRVAAIASVAGTVGVPSKDGGFKIIDPAVGPVSVMLIHGKMDRMVQYASTDVALLHGVGAMESAKWWAKQDGCSLTPTESKSPNGYVVTDTFPGGKNGTEVTLVSISNGTHDWPGGISRDGPETKTGVNAASLIWDFFKSHPKVH